MFGPHVERTNARYRLDNFLERQLVLEVLIKINNYERLPEDQRTCRESGLISP